MRREDPNFVPPNFAHASSAKRVREAEESEVRAKRERAGDEDGEEMDIDDDDEAGPPAPSTSNSMFTVLSYGAILRPLVPSVHSAQVQPSNKLSCSNLPQEVTNGVLAVLFQQYVVTYYLPCDSLKKTFRYRGFQTAQVKPSPKPNAAGEKVKTAEVVFENAQLAAVARQMLDGFQLKKGWNMAVTFLP